MLILLFINNLKTFLYFLPMQRLYHTCWRQFDIIRKNSKSIFLELHCVNQVSKNSISFFFIIFIKETSSQPKLSLVNISPRLCKGKFNLRSCSGLPVLCGYIKQLMKETNKKMKIIDLLILWLLTTFQPSGSI
jgi:hypothetical protein